MRKYSRKKRNFSVFFLAGCFLSALVITDYYAMSEVGFFSPNLTFENQDLPTLSGIEKCKRMLSSAESFLSLPVLGLLGHNIDFRAPLSPEENLSHGLRC
jgi:hypothetical protein